VLHRCHCSAKCEDKSACEIEGNQQLAAARARIPIDIAPDMPDLILKPLAIARPSVIVPVWNVVLFPAGGGFWDHVALETVEPFEFDPRLFPDNTPIEIPD